MGETQEAAVVVACILQRGTAIRSAGGYLRGLTRKAEVGEFSPWADPDVADQFPAARKATGLMRWKSSLCLAIGLEGHLHNDETQGGELAGTCPPRQTAICATFLVIAGYGKGSGTH